CHTSAGDIEGVELVGLIAGVDCVRCHGDAARHVARHTAGPKASSFADDGDRFVGRWSPRGQIEHCGDCHRLPRTLRETKLDRRSSKLARYPTVGLLQSACFLKTEAADPQQALTCTTCHDPHDATAVGLAARLGYERRCLECHPAVSAAAPNGIVGKACPTSPTTGCVGCHLPPVKVADHLVYHDHWIRVRSAIDPPAAKP
ncbi:MAG: hypothetical protein ACRDD1_15785, partial [Planctomycetia bacterium]